ncbi:hypothetical protein ACLB1M_34540 [Escherichia coli]
MIQKQLEIPSALGDHASASGYLCRSWMELASKQDWEMNIGNRFISGLRDGSAATDASTVGQMQRSDAETLSNSKSYTDTRLTDISKTINDRITSTEKLLNDTITAKIRDENNSTNPGH